jgi:hypothetical protein
MTAHTNPLYVPHISQGIFKAQNDCSEYGQHQIPKLTMHSPTVNFKTLFIGSGRIEIRATRKTGCATAVTGGPAISLAQTCSYNCGRARGFALKDRSTLRNIKLLV